MANKDLLKQAIAEAKSVREAAIANAKEALEETLTPHLKDMLAAKLQEMEDSQEEVVNESAEEVEEEVTEAQGNIDADGEEDHDQLEEEIEEALTEIEPAVEEAEDDSEESEDEAEEEEIEEPADEEGEEEAVDGDEDLGDLSVDQFKDMIRDIISQELGHEGEEELGADMDAGDIEGMGDEEGAIEEPALDGAEGEEEIDLDELLAELESISEEEIEEGKHEEEEMEEGAVNQMEAESDTADHNVNNVQSGTLKEELDEALGTIETLQKELHEVNLLNSKLLYVNKIFKANTLTESQKVNVIAAFDKAETVKEVKLVFETVTESGLISKKENVSESKVKGMASKATGTTAAKPGVIAEANEAVTRMQILAGIKPRQF